MRDWLSVVRELTSGWSDVEYPNWWMDDNPFHIPHNWDEQFTWPTLNPGDIVMEVGGYEGLWSSMMVEKYGVQIYLFEPSKSALARGKERIEAAGGSIVVYNAGLGYRNETIAFGGPDADGASFLKECEGQSANRTAQVLDIAEVMMRPEFADVALMQINIEGGEFVLLPRLINCGAISQVRYLQIQWHVGGYLTPHVETDRYYQFLIRHRLGLTHVGWPQWASEAWGRRDLLDA